ncbi:MAG: hypothetical protein AAGA54_19220 [Myxococcota bacterium]
MTSRVHGAVVLFLLVGCGDAEPSSAEPNAETETPQATTGDTSEPEPDPGTTSPGDGGEEGDSSSSGGACGDGVVDAGEDCDDGNLDDGDGCDATCLNERFDPNAFPLLPDPPAFGDWVMSPEGDLLYLGAGSSSTTVMRLPRAGGAAEALGEHPRGSTCSPTDLAASDDGRWFITGNTCGCLDRIDRQSGEGREEYFCDTTNGQHVPSVAFVPAAFGEGEGDVAVAFAPENPFFGSTTFIDFIHPETKTQTPFVQIDVPLTSIRFTPDGTELYAVGSQLYLMQPDGSLDPEMRSVLFRISSDRTVEELAQFPFMVTNFVFGDDATTLYLASPREGVGEFNGNVGGDGLWAFDRSAGSLDRLITIEEDIGEGFAPDPLAYDSHGLLYAVRGEIRHLEL